MSDIIEPANSKTTQHSPSKKAPTSMLNSLGTLDALDKMESHPTKLTPSYVSHSLRIANNDWDSTPASTYPCTSNPRRFLNLHSASRHVSTSTFQSSKFTSDSNPGMFLIQRTHNTRESVAVSVERWAISS
ncbi:hypothetical protein HK100_006723, partial [Physocladia obscura]